MAIHRHDPETFAHLRDDISIIGLKPLGAGSYGNTTYSRMPGAFVTSPVANPLVLADDLIHETYHNRLFAIEESGPFYRDDAARTDARHYSPWRPDPRPIFGVLHAFYVFTRVMRFWRRVYVDLGGAPSSDAADRPYTVQRLLELSGQLAAARETLESAGGFTPWGADVYAAIAAEFDRERGLVDALGLPDDTAVLDVAEDGTFAPRCTGHEGRPCSVKESLRRHREQFDRIMAHDQLRRSKKLSHEASSSK
jgi:hypothetical protein